MRSFIIYNVKYYLTDIYFIILLVLVLLNLFTATALPLQLPDFATFFVVYLLSVYVERDIGQPMPSLLAVRGRLAVAMSVYVSTSLGTGRRGVVYAAGSARAVAGDFAQEAGLVSARRSGPGPPLAWVCHGCGGV
jgi:hypothetical protein